MPWKNETGARQRWQFLCAVAGNREPLTAVCRRFHISRQTGYNDQRPHEALGMRVPAAVYRPSRRRLRRLRASRYPRGWPVLRTDAKGRAWWAGRARVIRRAFAGLHIGLKPAGGQRWQAYLDAHFLGLVVADDRAGLRPVQWRTVRSGAPGPPKPRPGAPERV